MAKTRLTLDHPLTLAEGQVSVLELRRPTVADVLEIEKMGEASDYEKDVALTARLCGRPREDLDGLDVTDFIKLQETMRGFFS